MKNYKLDQIVRNPQKLPKKDKVFINESGVNVTSSWTDYQRKELNFWDKVFFEKKYFPDYQEFSFESMHRWAVEESDFQGKVVLEVGCGPYGFFPGLIGRAKIWIPCLSRPILC